jgi:predicted DNA-binding ribbon-helix-helix protein
MGIASATRPTTDGTIMKSQVVKRSIVIAGHKTSVSLEDAFWDDLREIATGKDKTLSDLVAEIDSTRQQGNLSSAIRLYVLENVRGRQKRGERATLQGDETLSGRPTLRGQSVRSE